jgi:predicted metal-dependent hydrolase
VEAFDPDRWQDCRPYLYGLDLFNHGYYWEAHETWEDLWHACGRQGLTADFLKGLIKLAAAGVKAREAGGIRRGIRSHAQGAADLFRRTAERLGNAGARYLGLSVNDLVIFAQQVEASAAGNATVGVPCRFPIVLVPFPWPSGAET